MKLKIEATRSYQVEDAKGGYCATVYSKADARLVRDLARDIPHLKCLREHSGGTQAKGIYIYRYSEPLVEVYDGRLAQRVRQHINEIKGD